MKEETARFGNWACGSGKKGQGSAEVTHLEYWKHGVPLAEKRTLGNGEGLERRVIQF